MKNQDKTSFFKKGFTLIELLVVIAIIGILASVILVSVNAARSKARDATRLSVARQVKTALELYYADHGYYPLCYNGAYLCTSTSGIIEKINTLDIVPQYISKIDNDPLNVEGEYGYYYARGYVKATDGTPFLTGKITDYVFGMRLENSSAPAYNAWLNPYLNYLDSNTRL